MKYKVVILDLDNTLIDFDYMEVMSLKSTLEHYGIRWTQEMIKDYQIINQSLWEKLEQGAYSKEEILLKRFEILKNRYDLNYNSEQVNDRYLEGMADHTKYMPFGHELLVRLQGKCKLVMLTNGVEKAQSKKVEKLGLGEYFNEIIVSETVGLHKPDVRIFEYMEDKIGIYDKKDIIIIGDSLTSDIKGGMNYSIDTCFYNPKGKEIPDYIRVNYEISCLSELIDILELD